MYEYYIDEILGVARSSLENSLLKIVLNRWCL